MRDLTPLELQAICGGIQAMPAPRPRIDLRRIVLALISRILGRPAPRPRAPCSDVIAKEPRSIGKHRGSNTRQSQRPSDCPTLTQPRDRTHKLHEKLG
jgi:hypothetical protein